MKIQWKGVYPAVTTKFTSNDELDLQAFDVNINAQIEAGVNGIILGGSLGEASTLSDEEKFKLLVHSVELAAGKIDVVLNIAEQSTKVAIDIAKRAEDSGADALMLLTPMRYKSDDRETVTFFKDIAKSTSLPIMLYNNPVDYKIMITLDMFDELAELDNIQAVKESTRDVMNITRMYNKFGSRYKVLCGVDPLALESLVLGCDGWVAGLVDAFPKETVAIYRLIKAGRYAEALAIYRWFMPLLELDIHPKLVQYIKLAEVYTGIGTETVRSPRLSIEGAERKAVTKVITDALAIRPELPADSWGPVSITA